MDLHIKAFVKRKEKESTESTQPPPAPDIDVNNNVIPLIENATTSDKKDMSFIKLPYFGKYAENFGSKLTKFVKKLVPSTQLNIVFTAPKEIGNHFKFKDRVTEVMRQSLCVYHIKCKDCSADYIGKTKRTLAYRIREHSRMTTSNVYKHHLDTGHHIDYDGVKIIDRADNDRKLQIKEILHIDRRNPSLNKQLNLQDEFRIFTNICGSKKV